MVSLDVDFDIVYVFFPKASLGVREDGIMTEELLQILFMEQVINEDVKTDKDQPSTMKQEVKTETSTILGEMLILFVFSCGSKSCIQSNILWSDVASLWSLYAFDVLLLVSFIPNLQCLI